LTSPRAERENPRVHEMVVLTRGSSTSTAQGLGGQPSSSNTVTGDVACSRNIYGEPTPNSTESCGWRRAIARISARPMDAGYQPQDRGRKPEGRGCDFREESFRSCEAGGGGSSR